LGRSGESTAVANAWNRPYKNLKKQPAGGPGLNGQTENSYSEND